MQGTETIIGTIRAGYRLRPSQLGHRQRLDRLLPEVFGEALEIALDRAGLRPSEIVCIHSIFIPVRLRTSHPDSSLIAEWSLAVAKAIDNAQSAETVGPSLAPGSILRYRSLSAALIEMGTLVAQGRFHTIWAWRQMDFWRGNAAAASLNDGAIEFAEALAREPQLATAVMAALAGRGLLHQLIARTDASTAGSRSGGVWTRVAAAVLMSSGVDERFLLREPDLPIAGDVSTRTTARAASAFERSKILHACRALRLQRSTAFAMAIFGLLEYEPALLHAGLEELFTTVCAVRDQISAAPGTRPIHVPDAIATVGTIGTVSTELRLESLSETTLPILRSVRPAGLRSSTPGAGDETGVPEPSRNTDVSEATATEAVTEFGGILFLLNLLDSLNIPQRAVASPVLAPRAFRWCQHQLALALQPLAPDDPAALAFCGLGHGEEYPSNGQPPASREEEQAIAEFAADIIAALAAALPGHARSDGMLMHFVCRRTARITADPGWIEARFSLQSVSTEIRRAGLDLNPDYLPWLGAVVRFVYE